MRNILKITGMWGLIIIFFMTYICYGKGLEKQHCDRGVKYAAQGRFEEAKKEFETALKIDPFYSVVISSLDVIEDALNLKIEKDVAIHIFTGLDNYNTAVNYNNIRKLDEAITELDKAISINPNYASAYVNRAFLCFNRGLTDRVISDCSKAIELKPTYADAYNGRGIAYYDKGLVEQAMADFNKTIEINPGYFEAFNNRGSVYRDQKKFDLAISEYTKAIQINPQYAIAYYNRGVAYYNHSDKNLLYKAIDDFNKAIEINPKDPFSYFDKALACEEVGRLSEAVDAYRNFLQYASPKSLYTSYIRHAEEKIKKFEG